MIDRARAHYCLMAAGLSGILCGRPENIRYLTGAVPVTARMGIDGASLAWLPADPLAPITLIQSHFSYYYGTADTGLTNGAVPSLYESAGAVELFRLAEGAAAPPRELRRRAALAAAGPIRPALANAVKAALGTGFTGFDSLEAARQLSQPESRDASDVMRHLRMIKCEDEIALIRAATAANTNALRATMEGARATPSLNGLRQAFAGHCARLGNRLTFMVVDSVPNEEHDEPIAEGRSIMLDCVSSRRGYQADIARTLCFGEPTAAIARAIAATEDVWSELRETLRPGLAFSTIRDTATAMMKKAAPDLVTGFNPHLTGLEHTEQPRMTLDERSLDLCLQPGMVLSVDCPLLVTGIGGSVHYEDLVLITEHGAVPLHETPPACLIV